VRRVLADGYELDDDRTRVDLREVHRVLSTECYWALGRSYARMEDLVAGAARVVGLYRDDEQVGFARVVSDGLSLAYLADVFVAAPHRRRGLGLELVREAVDHGPHRDLRWMLHTHDMQGLYARLGFAVPARPALERPPRD